MKASYYSLAAVLAIVGCSTQSSNQQEAAENEAAPPAATASDEASAYGGAAKPAPAPGSEVSSGMPVPGTNTPEHVVVNEADGIASSAARHG